MSSLIIKLFLLLLLLFVPVLLFKLFSLLVLRERGVTSVNEEGLIEAMELLF